jgi:hypothetical protein
MQTMFEFVNLTSSVLIDAGMTSDQFLSLPPASRERFIISKLAAIRAVLDAWPQRSSDYHASMRVTLRQQFVSNDDTICRFLTSDRPLIAPSRV